MPDKSKYIALVCSVSSAAVIAIFFLMTFHNAINTPIRWVSLLFLVIAEALGIIKTFTVKRTILDIASITTSIIHVMAVLIISIIFTNIITLSIKKYIILNVLFICILLFVDALLILFKNRVAMQNEKLNSIQSTMEYLAEKAASLYMEFKDTGYKKDLEEIVELIRYSDNSSLSKAEQAEMEIINMLDELRVLLKSNNDNAMEPMKYISEIKKAIKMRSLKLANEKRGSC